MAPNKFEKHIKKELENREIQPSANAWHTLSEKLDEIPNEPKRKGYIWYAVAASFIGILIVSILFVNSDGVSPVQDTQIVDTSENEIDTVETKMDKGVEKRYTESKVAEVDVIDSENKDEKTIEEYQFINSKKQLAQVEKTNTLSDKAQLIVKIVETPEDIINTKILEVVAQVDALELDNAILTDMEVDSLLLQAQQELLENKIFHNGNSVDAMALLNEVEDELDRSFRDQIFETLKTGFLKVRTAVADRNN